MASSNPNFLPQLATRRSVRIEQHEIQAAETPEPLLSPAVAGQYINVKALPGNSGTVELRAGTGGEGAGWPLAPGEELGLLPLASTSGLHAFGAAGDVVAYYAIE